MGMAPSVLSMVSVTSARPSAGRPVVPAKMTSSILPPRRDFAPCSPRTQAMASTTLDLPEPLGPTTQVMPGSKRRVVAEAKDLNPFSVRLLRYNGQLRGAALRGWVGPRVQGGPARIWEIGPEEGGEASGRGRGRGRGGGAGSPGGKGPGDDNARRLAYSWRADVPLCE